jgi:hypothetical protein
MPPRFGLSVTIGGIRLLLHNDRPRHRAWRARMVARHRDGGTKPPHDAMAGDPQHAGRFLVSLGDRGIERRHVWPLPDRACGCGILRVACSVPESGWAPAARSRCERSVEKGLRLRPETDRRPGDGPIIVGIELAKRRCRSEKTRFRRIAIVAAAEP